MKTFLTTVKGTFSPELTGHLAARLGESETRVRKVLGAAVPLVLGAIIRQAQAGAALQVHALSLQALRKAPTCVSPVTCALGMLGSGPAAGGALRQAEVLLFALFGAEALQLADQLSAHAGVQPAAAEDLVKLVGAVAAATLGQQAQHATAAELAVCLANLKVPVAELLASTPPAMRALLAPLGPKQAVGEGLLGALQQERGAGLRKLHVQMGQSLLAFVSVATGTAFLWDTLCGLVAATYWAADTLPVLKPAVPLVLQRLGTLNGFTW
ncbi:DUF937 domain-containing protein [Hymenobacter sp. 5317J-9]|uniref:DUF937 domain-containing protein n=1 Tax=Hymenobacter sp. 5317J-9 TaxID=2932250 RepID=UPI001FD6CE20|nr:DUF937 domain-containing protein [Hymenobacter sp. 5317J-9]UOQ99725.1 DUF937 domain-containing protein [Hymenobacter sp. 5317J-9]